MNDGLIGYSGFVGSTLRRQTGFTGLFRSTNIATIDGQAFDTLVCAGAPAQKWLANRDPDADRRGLDDLMVHLGRVRCSRLVLVSTVDVFAHPVAVDEDSPVDTTSLHAYGRHRRDLERFVEDRFPDHLIVRLPGLVGPGLRKNVIFDFLNGNNLAAIDSRAVFQFYPMVNLWTDIQVAVRAGLRLVHLTAEPVGVAAIAAGGFGLDFDNQVAAIVPAYDMRSRHAALFGGRTGYQYSARESLLAIRAYAQSEPATPHHPAAS